MSEKEKESFFKTETTGEKTYEEFYSEDEEYDLTKYDSLGYIKPQIDSIFIDEVQDDFQKVFDNESSVKEDIITVIKKYIPNFKHIETGKHLDQKM